MSSSISDFISDPDTLFDGLGILAAIGFTAKNIYEFKQDGFRFFIKPPTHPWEVMAKPSAMTRALCLFGLSNSLYQGFKAYKRLTNQKDASYNAQDRLILASTCLSLAGFLTCAFPATRFMMVARHSAFFGNLFLDGLNLGLACFSGAPLPDIIIRVVLTVAANLGRHDRQMYTHYRNMLKGTKMPSVEALVQQLDFTKIETIPSVSLTRFCQAVNTHRKGRDAGADRLRSAVIGLGSSDAGQSIKPWPQLLRELIFSQPAVAAKIAEKIDIESSQQPHFGQAMESYLLKITPDRSRKGLVDNLALLDDYNLLGLVAKRYQKHLRSHLAKLQNQGDQDRYYRVSRIFTEREYIEFESDNVRFLPRVREPWWAIDRFHPVKSFFLRPVFCHFGGPYTPGSYGITGIVSSLVHLPMFFLMPFFPAQFVDGIFLGSSLFLFTHAYRDFKHSRVLFQAWDTNLTLINKQHPEMPEIINRWALTKLLFREREEYQQDKSNYFFY